MVFFCRLVPAPGAEREPSRPLARRLRRTCRTSETTDSIHVAAREVAGAPIRFLPDMHMPAVGGLSSPRRQRLLLLFTNSNASHTSLVYSHLPDLPAQPETQLPPPRCSPQETGDGQFTVCPAIPQPNMTELPANGHSVAAPTDFRSEPCTQRRRLHSGTLMVWSAGRMECPSFLEGSQAPVRLLAI